MIELAFIVIAPAIGSWMGLYHERFLYQEDTLITPSRCRLCSRRLGASEMIPILSYLWQKGRCRQCHQPIPFRLLLWELSPLLLALWAWTWAGDKMIPTCLLGWGLLLLGWMDWSYQRLPDTLNALLFVLGYLVSLFFHPNHLLTPLISALIAGSSFWLLRLLYKLIRRSHGMGLGDVKFFAAIAPWFSPWTLPWIPLIGALSALIAVGVSAAYRKRPINPQDPIPFGTFLSFGALITWWMTSH